MTPRARAVDANRHRAFTGDNTCSHQFPIDEFVRDPIEFFGRDVVEGTLGVSEVGG